MNIPQIITAALQFAIASFKHGKQVDRVVIEFRDRYWRDYDTPQIQAAAERAIRNFYQGQVKSQPTVPEPVKDIAEFANIAVNAMTKEQLLQVAEIRGAKVKKYWPKAKSAESRKFSKGFIILRNQVGFSKYI